MYDLRRPCDADPECAHKVCWVCEQPIRSDKQKKDEHPGAKPGHIRDRLCDRCKIEGHKSIHDTPQPEPEPEPEVLPDERHVILSDKHLDHMRSHHPTQYAWTMRRRKKLGLKKHTPLEQRIQTLPRRHNGLPLGVYGAPAGKWKVSLRENGQTKYYGVYPTIEEAAKVAAQHWKGG